MPTYYYTLYTMWFFFHKFDYPTRKKNTQVFQINQNGIWIIPLFKGN
jgi:hypothetical protein